MFKFVVIYKSIHTSLSTQYGLGIMCYLDSSNFKYFNLTDLANTHKHFGGGASCFSCRAFFRRIVRKKKPTKCQGGVQKCVIDIINRALCAFCRYQKCLSIGMDPQRVMKEEYLQEKKKNR